LLDHLRTHRPAERTTFFVIYRFPMTAARAGASGLSEPRTE
jgi:hypothetical protein